MNTLTGQTIKNYHLLHKLGDGGMAEVYLAEHLTLSRQVAIKLIRPELSQDKVFRTRFEREARIAAQLNHPNIVQILDFGEFNNRHYLVMEYIHGVTLKQYLRTTYAAGKALSLDEIITLITHLGDALDYIHRAGIVHRDVKPDNILLTPEGREHILSDGKQISPASDIYSLGVILFELLSGKPPFTAQTPILVMLKQLHDPIPDLTTTFMDLPDQIEDVIRTALAKDPAARYQKASHFTRDLHEALEMTVRLSRRTPEPAIC